MITLYSYPELFGVADNNPYGVKIFAFLKLCGLEFFRAGRAFFGGSRRRPQFKFLFCSSLERSQA